MHGQAQGWGEQGEWEVGRRRNGKGRQGNVIVSSPASRIRLAGSQEEGSLEGILESQSHLNYQRGGGEEGGR